MDRYEEALAKARVEYEKARKQGYTWLMDLLEGMFPDLKESEDERIRKFFAELATDACGGPGQEYYEELGLNYDKVMNWLERQKTSEEAIRYIKENHSPDEVSDFQAAMNIAVAKAYDKGVQDTLEKQKEYPTNEEMLRTLRAEYEKGVADTIAKYEQKEQKFTEKQDYSGLNDLERAIHRGFLVVGVENVPVTIIKETAQDCLAWMKPAEWSEEDEEMRINILQEIANIKDVFPKINIQPEFDWLKSLPERFNLQLKNEWSEDWREEDIQTRFAFYTYKDDPSVLYLSNVFVEETSRNHGFGTRILRAAEKVAETIGATTISLKVKQNSHANAWYRKNGYGYVTFEDGYDWLEKNLEYMKPDKSVEWSEKEMAYCMKLAISAIEYYYDAENPFRDKLIHWLKSLRPQHQQNMSIGFMLYLDEIRPEGKMCLSNAECNDIEDAFKKQDWPRIFRYIEKYQPHWKPSEEQMKALNEAVGGFRMEDTASCEKTADTLESLYNELRKL